MLCVVEPERFLPVLKYSAPTDGKKEIAKLVFDLDLPPAEKVAWTIGRLVVWSNDLLRSLVGNDIPDLQHATQFLGLGEAPSRSWRGTKGLARQDLAKQNRPWSGGEHTPPPSEGRAP